MQHMLQCFVHDSRLLAAKNVTVTMRLVQNRMLLFIIVIACMEQVMRCAKHYCHIAKSSQLSAALWTDKFQNMVLLKFREYAVFLERPVELSHIPFNAASYVFHMHRILAVAAELY